MSKNDTWYGFLDAGKKSSPVVRDSRLETSSPKTIYLFNYAQGKFLEYSREVVEPKLRDLPADDDLLEELRSAYKAARKVFIATHGAHKRAVKTAIRKIKNARLSALEDFPGVVLEDSEDFLPEDDYAD